jgi:hypothetical protein
MVEIFIPTFGSEIVSMRFEINSHDFVVVNRECLSVSLSDSHNILFVSLLFLPADHLTSLNKTAQHYSQQP